VAVYGSTEAEPMTEVAYSQLSNEDMQRMRQGAGLLVGRPVGSLHLKIMVDQWGKPLGPYSGEDFATLCCEPEQAGEIVVSGDHVLVGYVGGRGDEETKFRVGNTIWHRTGDAGYLDARGRLWLLGRCAARLDDGNGLLYPFTVECAASFQPGIRRAAIAALAGRRILAVVADAAVEANFAVLKDDLAWAHLDEIRTLKYLPVDKRHNAKIDYPAFREMLSGQTD
jgi:acyl-CoA synthetase (AMP-forming)/AMP-acid ligase II